MNCLRYSYDIFSLVISILVLIYVIKIRSLGTFRNRTYFLYVFLVIAICFMDLILGLLVQFLPDAHLAIIIVDSFIHSFVFFCPVTFLVYIFALVDYFQMIPDENRTMLPFKIFFPISISFFLIWASVFYDSSAHMFSYLDSFGGLPGGMNGYVIEFLICCYYIGFGVVTMVQHKFRLEKNVVFLLCLAFLLVVASLLIQGIFPDIRALPVAFAFSLIIFSLFVQKPEFLSTSKDDVMNDKAFDIIISDYFIHKYNFKIIILFMEDSFFYKEILGQNELSLFEECMTKKLKGLFRDTILLKDDTHGFYYLLFKNADNQEIENAIDSINEQIKSRWGYKGIRFDFSFRLCIVDGATDVSSVDNLRNLAYAFTHLNQYKGMCINARDLDLLHIESYNQIEQAVKTKDFKNLFTVMYQPIFSVRDKKITRAEALLCFKNNKDIFFTTDSFIPVFEKSGHFFNINAFAFISVCEMLSSIDIKSLGLEKIGINVSLVDSTQQDLFDQIKNRLDFYKVSPHLVHFELTQSASFNFPDVIVSNLQRFSSYGIEIVLDDFGIGNSNIEQMVNLSIGMIKLDAKVIDIAWSNSKIGNVVKVIVKLAHDMGLHVIANGVETLEQRIWLEGIECDYLQGNLFSKPVPEDEFLRLLQDKTY
ncbi:MAG: EAL domain-containing protein [Treponemataceae bacterium]|nr:EAL domain-containing protein [Treponemataceae bacterium]